MVQPDGPLTLIQGQVVHKTSNALKITFADGPGDPLATGVQGGNDGRGKKLATLFGFKNGGAGNHVLTYADGSTLQVASRDSAPTVLTRGDGTEVATIHRGAGQALPMPILGTRFVGRRALTGEQREVLLAACVDIAIGLRSYIEAMR